MKTADVIVIGGGVVGCAVAFCAARERLSVVVLERDAIGAHASGVAAGMLTPLAEAHDEAASLPLGLESLALFPDLVAELRPVSPDGLPLVGPAPGLGGLVLAVGHSRNGVLLSALTGELVVDLVRGKGLPEAASAFRPERF